MTTTAEQETQLAPPNPATLGSVLAENIEEVSDDLEALGVGILDELPSAERSKLLAFGDRLLRRLAADEAEVTDITAAAKAEVQLVTLRYQALAQKVTKRATWKRWCLEQLAAILFPDAAAKSKSINLPYGTLGRKDYKPAPELVDAEAATTFCMTHAPSFVDATIEAPRSVLYQWLINLLVGSGVSPAVATERVNEFLAALAKGDELAGEAPALTQKLRWGAVKKQAAQGVEIAGVQLSEPRTVFYADVTAG